VRRFLGELEAHELSQLLPYCVPLEEMPNSLAYLEPEDNRKGKQKRECEHSKHFVMRRAQCQCFPPTLQRASLPWPSPSPPTPTLASGLQSHPREKPTPLQKKQNKTKAPLTTIVCQA